MEKNILKRVNRLRKISLHIRTVYAIIIIEK